MGSNGLSLSTGSVAILLTAALMQQIISGAKRAKCDVLLVAPFIKLNVVEMVLAALGRGVRLRVITRWRLDEVQAGVSDIEIYEPISMRGNSSLALANQLHAKYYRFDDFVLTGSANLTQTGLGVFGNAIEILEQRTAGRSVEFENLVRAASFDVNQEIYRIFQDLVRQNNRKSDAQQHESTWFPEFRNPHDLWSAYSSQSYPKINVEAARRDLQALGVPDELDQLAFQQRIKIGLLNQSIVAGMIAFLETPRRFGEFRQWVAATRGRSDATSEAQTLLRWVSTFLPELVSFEASPYSEVVRRRQ